MTTINVNDLSPSSVRPVDLSSLLVYAARYALGRVSYAPGEVCACLRRYRRLMLTGDLQTVIRDITQHEERNDLGHDVDRADWLRAREELRQEWEGRQS